MSTAETLRALLDGPYPETRERVRWWLSQPGNEPADDLPLEEHRARVLEWVKELASQGDTAIGYPVQHGGRRLCRVARMSTVSSGRRDRKLRR